MNHFGEATANVNLNIEAEPEPKGQAPVFVEKPTIKFEEKAGRVLMEALVRADPKPTSTWSKDGKQLDASRVTATVTLEKEELYRIRLVLRVTSERYATQHLPPQLLIRLLLLTAALATAAAHSCCPCCCLLVADSSFSAWLVLCLCCSYSLRS